MNWSDSNLPVDLQPAKLMDPSHSLPERVAALSAIARQVRRISLRRAHSTGLGHLGSDFSVTDILVTLYFSVMKLSRAGAADPDRLILSKGHAAVALYGTLIAAGLVDSARLATWGRGDGLPGHPTAGTLPGIDATTGALGHGLSLGVGRAIAARRDNSATRTFVVVGDGELQEGSNWEALMLGAHLRLGNLAVVVDANRLQQGAWTNSINSLEPLPAKLESFGWACESVNGHDFSELMSALTPEPDPNGPPRAVVAQTIKGHGVSFMSDDPSWHHRIPNDDELILALAELRG